GHRGHPGARGAARVEPAEAAAADLDLAVVPRTRAGEALGDPLVAGAEQAGEADDLARRDSEGGPLEAGGADAVDAQQRLALLLRREWRADLRDVGPDDVVDQLGLGRLVRLDHAHVATVA